MVSEDLIEAAKTIESLTGVPPTFPGLRRMTRGERREQAARVRRFLALSPQLQEGLLRYGENIRQAYIGSKE
jgi:hypothetical protein